MLGQAKRSQVSDEKESFGGGSDRDETLR